MRAPVIAWMLLAALAPALVTPSWAAPSFLVGHWYGEGQPRDRSVMWLAHMLPDGVFQVQFRTCRKGKPFDEFETGRWVLAGDVETITIATVNGKPSPRQDQYRMMAHDKTSQTYKYLRTGFTYVSHRVDAKFRIPDCDMVS